MNKNSFIEKLVKYRFISQIWANIIKYIIEPIDNDENVNKLVVMYFVIICDGSTCMPISQDKLINYWINKCEEMKVLLLSTNEDSSIEPEINDIKECGIEATKYIDLLINNEKLIDDNKLFVIDNGYIFTRQYFRAKNGIKDSINRLFLDFNDDCKIDFSIKDVWPTAADKQIEVINKGLNRNLIVTGGPGTGKTTAIFYLLLALLKNHKDYNVYMTAPSGKASSRIKESINGEIANARKNNLKGFDEEIDKLSKTTEYTIHRLLSNDYKTNGFSYNENNQFSDNSIFIIDEASMIDISIFDCLLKAIPNKARVFILGDKYQLPSVENGAVLSDLLNYEKLKDNIVELEKSHRFVEGSEIYELAKKVNNGEAVNINFSNEFNIVERVKGEYPVFYYDTLDNIDSFNNAITLWGKHFYKDMQKMCTGIEFEESTLETIFNRIDEARVLSAENEGRVGVSTINKIIKDSVIDKNSFTQVKGFYQGMPLMILKNNESLHLYNGDTGILVSFKDSNTLYFLIEKESNNYKEATSIEDKVLKKGKFMLYPLRMLDLNDVMPSYAITIHKSQGSGYLNIMVVLPKKQGHPLLNRQILYTAITRTKGPTYIVSNNERINEAIKNVSTRDTRVFD